MADRVEDYLRLQRMRVWVEAGQLRCEAAGYDYVYVCCDQEYSSSSSPSSGGGGGSGVNCAGCTNIPATLTVQFSDANGGCPCLDGISLNVSWDSVAQKWTGSKAACGSTLDVEIWCQDTGGSTQLMIRFRCGGGAWDGDYGISITSCYLPFQGSVSAAAADTCCPMGQVNISITG